MWDSNEGGQLSERRRSSSLYPFLYTLADLEYSLVMAYDHDLVFEIFSN